MVYKTFALWNRIREESGMLGVRGDGPCGGGALPNPKTILSAVPVPQEERRSDHHDARRKDEPQADAGDDEADGNQPGGDGGRRGGHHPHEDEGDRIQGSLSNGSARSGSEDLSTHGD